MRTEPNTDYEHYIDFLEDLMNLEREKILFAMAEASGNTNSTLQEREELADDYLEGYCDYDFLGDERSYKILNKNVEWFRDQFEEKIRYE